MSDKLVKCDRGGGGGKYLRTHIRAYRQNDEIVVPSGKYQNLLIHNINKKILASGNSFKEIRDGW